MKRCLFALTAALALASLGQAQTPQRPGGLLIVEEARASAPAPPAGQPVVSEYRGKGCDCGPACACPQCDCPTCRTGGQVAYYAPECTSESCKPVRHHRRGHRRGGRCR